MVDMSEVFNSGLEELITVKAIEEGDPDINILAIIDFGYSPGDGGFRELRSKKEAYTVTGFIQSKDLDKIDCQALITIRGTDYRIREIIDEQTDIVTIIFGQKTT